MIRHLSAIWTFRYFLFAVVRLDLRMRYKRSMLGVGWSLLNPIAMSAVFVIVFTQLLGGGNFREYAPSLLLGMAIWGFLRDSAVVGCHALISNEAYIRQSPLPLGLYPLRTVLGLAIHSSIAFGVALGVLCFFRGGFAPLGILWAVIPGLILGLLAAWGAATLFAFVNVYCQDTKHVMDIGAQMLFFLTPIFYPVEVLTKRGLGWLARINPVNLFLELIRTPLMHNEPPPAELLIKAAIGTALLLVFSAWVVSRMQKRVIFHL